MDIIERFFISWRSKCMKAFANDMSRAVLQTEREKVIREMSHRENRPKNSLLFSLSRTQTHATITLNMTKDPWSTHSFLHLASAWYFKGKDKQKIYIYIIYARGKKRTKELQKKKKHLYDEEKKKQQQSNNNFAC